jgi:hypothetical protein
MWWIEGTHDSGIFTETCLGESACSNTVAPHPMFAQFAQVEFADVVLGIKDALYERLQEMAL